VSNPFSYVQGGGGKSTNGSGVTSFAVSMSNPEAVVAVGDPVYAWCSAFMSSSTATIGMSDVFGNTWTPIAQLTQTNNASKLALFRSIITNGGTGFTATFTPSASTFFPSAGIDEFNATGFTLSQDGSAVTATGDSSSLSAGTLTPAGTDLIYAVGSMDNASSWSSSTQTLTFTSLGAGGQADAGAGGYTLNVASPETPVITSGTVASWCFIAVALLATPISGGFQPWIYGDQIQDIYG
jgi:hypothetical protein